MTLHIGTATRDELPDCIGIVSDALAHDPVIEAMLPGITELTGPDAEAERLRRVTAMTTADLIGVHANGVLDTVRLDPGGPIVGVGAWEGPRPRSGLALQAKQLWWFGRAVQAKHLKATRAADAAYRRHRPKEPHWFLADIAIGPEARGTGAGSALLRYRLEAIDAHGLPAYLESTTPGSRRLYERFGFRVVEPIGLAADGYPMAMLRPAGG